MRASLRPPFAVLCFLALLAGCSTPPAPAPIRPVRTIKVGDLKAIGAREFPGRAAAKDDVELSFQVAGPLVAFPVDVGTKVKQGEVIAAIDPRDFETALSSAEGSLARAKSNLLAMERGARPEELEQLRASVAQAEASNQQASGEHERNIELLKAGAVSQSEFDISLARMKRTAAELKTANEALKIGIAGARPEDLDAKRSEIRALEAAVAAAKNQLSYATLTAPFDGEVAARYVDNFQTVQAKQPIVRLLDLSKIEVTVQIPENLIGLVPQVQQVDCRFDALPGQEFTGKVTKIGREASQTTRTYPVTVEVEQPKEARILPGMAATIRNHPVADEGSSSEEFIVPPSSVFTSAESSETYVWLVGSNSKVVRQTVKTGDLTPVGLRIVEGLSAGDVVVTAGVNTLREGQQVKLL